MHRITVENLLRCSSPFAVGNFSASAQESCTESNSYALNHNYDERCLEIERSACTEQRSGTSKNVRSSKKCSFSASKKRRTAQETEVSSTRLKVSHDWKVDASCSGNNREPASGVSRSGSPVQLLPLWEQLPREVRLVGCLQLWNSKSHVSVCPLKVDCLAFVDETAAICCTLRNIDPRLIGCSVQLVSWNYIPVKNGGGCIEIQKMEVIEEVGVDSKQKASFPSLCLSPFAANVRNHMLEATPLKNNARSVRLTLAGCLRFISPSFGLPCRHSKGNSQCDTTTTLFPEAERIITGMKASSTPNDADRMQSAASDEKRVKGTGLVENMQGFLAVISVCKHSSNCDAAHWDSCLTVGRRNPNANMNQKAAHIYFSGSTAAWRPILSIAMGECIVVTGLRKKVLIVGTERTEYHVFAATRTSVISFPGSVTEKNHERSNYHHKSMKCNCKFKMGIGESKEDSCDCDGSHVGDMVVSPSIQMNRPEDAHKGNAIWKNLMAPMLNDGKQGMEVVSYVGVVTNVFLQGGLIELDECAWLLLTHQPLNQVHGLRVGSMVAAMHVHAIKIENKWQKSLLLGACGISHVFVVCFSPFTTPLVLRAISHSRLSAYIESLPFVYAFWALQIIASFRQKFQGVYRDRDILGSTKTEGIAEKYMSNFLSLGVKQNRDILKELFSHDQACSLAKSSSGHLPLQVPPFANFCDQIKILWHNPISLIYRGDFKVLQGKDGFAPFQASALRKSSLNEHVNNGDCFFRRVISSEDLGVTLLGFLQFCQLSGKLQLVDASGAIDVVIPDFQSVCHIGKTYQVSTFSLVVEGFDESHFPCTGGKSNLPLSWANILRGAKFKSEYSRPLLLYAIFFMKEAFCVQLPKVVCSDMDKCGQTETSEESNMHLMKVMRESAKLHMLLLTHKYPMKTKPFAEQMKVNQLSFSAEAVLLPYNIVIPNKSERVDHQISGGAVDGVCCSPSKSREQKKLPNRILLLLKGGDYGVCTCEASITQAEEVGITTRSEMTTVLLQFSNQSMLYYHVLKLGQCYLVSVLQDFQRSITINSRSQLWSMAIVSCSDQEMSTRGVGDGFQLTDAVLKVPKTFFGVLENAIEKARTFVSLVSSVREAVDDIVSSKPYKNYTSSEGGLLDGTLISLQGIVQKIKSNGTLCQEKGLLFRSKQNTDLSCRFFMQQKVILYVKDLGNSQMVTIECDFRRYVFPVGLGPGATVSFHRVLAARTYVGALQFRAIPTTLIVVHKIKELGSLVVENRNWDMCGVKCIHVEDKRQNNDSLGVYLIRNLAIRESSMVEYMQVHCRVIAVERLILQRQKGSREGLANSLHFSCPLELNFMEVHHMITFASFIIDDGSGIARCWATDDRAACLLNLPSLPGEDHCFDGDHKKLSTTAILARQINVLLGKYGQVLLESDFDTVELASNSYMIRGGADETLSSREEEVVHAIVQRACHAGPLIIIAKLLPEVKETRMKLLTTMQTNGVHILAKPQLFAREVGPLNHISELKKATAEISSIFGRQSST